MLPDRLLTDNVTVVIIVKKLKLKNNFYEIYEWLVLLGSSYGQERKRTLSTGSKCAKSTFGFFFRRTFWRNPAHDHDTILRQTPKNIQKTRFFQYLMILNFPKVFYLSCLLFLIALILGLLAIC